MDRDGVAVVAGVDEDEGVRVCAVDRDGVKARGDSGTAGATLWRRGEVKRWPAVEVKCGGNARGL